MKVGASMEEHYLIVDTEAISVSLPYIYDIGYVVVSTDLDIIAYGHFVLDQIYYNKMLFETAYYKNKRPQYVSRLKGRKAKMKKVGHAMRTLSAIMKEYNIKNVFAYNCKFDRGAFEKTCEYFKCHNPFEKKRWLDIQSLANHSIHKTEEYHEFCKQNKYITPKGYLRTNVEKTYEFITGKPFKESHIGIDDCLAELEILRQCDNITTRKPLLFPKFRETA